MYFLGYFYFHNEIQSIDALVEALNDYSGGVVIVSHDARLILETNCQLWECADRTVKHFDGNFYDYREAVLEALESDDVVIEGRKQ